METFLSGKRAAEVVPGGQGFNAPKETLDYTAFERWKLVSRGYQTPGGESLKADASGGAFTVTLPPLLNAPKQRIPVRVKRVDSSANAVTIAAEQGATIDGAATYALTAPWSCVTLANDGANWLVVAKV